MGSNLVEGYESMSTNAEDYRNQAVLILGKGNSAFETAQNLLGKASVVHMISTNTVRLAWQTHYVGDVRYCFPAIVTGFKANTFRPSLQDNTYMMQHKSFVVFCGLPPRPRRRFRLSKPVSRVEFFHQTQRPLSPCRPVSQSCLLARARVDPGNNITKGDHCVSAV